MNGEYRVIPLALLALYLVCSVCPERFLPGSSAVQGSGENEAHDCHGDNRSDSDQVCRTAVSESLPSSTTKFLNTFDAQALLQDRSAESLPSVSLASKRLTHFSTAGPPPVTLSTKLRI